MKRKDKLKRTDELVRIYDQTVMIITPQLCSGPRLAYHDQLVFVDYELRLLCTVQANGKTVVEYGIILTASNLGGWDEQLRQQLLRHPYLEVSIHDADVKPDWDNIHVHVDDPKGILAWLFPGGNFSFITKSLQQHGDKETTPPLQLPAPGEG